VGGVGGVAGAGVDAAGTEERDERVEREERDDVRGSGTRTVSNAFDDTSNGSDEYGSDEYEVTDGRAGAR
jgi:hypothetical protein